ncbi:MAG: mechanosensitive ion channel family protein [Methanomassiliicoccaceae archaeon]|nr:mechanosensitive ion channel family protein [Methanomassiliicoccaceae archaeon]
MGAKRTALILTAVAVSLLLAVPLFSDHAEGAEAKNVVYSLSPGSGGVTDIYAGGSIDIHVDLYNKSGSIRCVEFTGYDFGGKGKVETPDTEGPIVLQPGEHFVLHVKMTAERYLSSVDVNVILKFTAYDPSDLSKQTFDITKTVHICSGRASEDKYNKILGIFDNPLPSPFDAAIYSAAATLAIWICIAALISFALVPVVMRFVIKDDDEQQIRRVRRPLFFMILLYGLTVCVAVMGISEYLISTVEVIAGIIYILFGAAIAWFVYSSIISAWKGRAVNDGREHDLSVVPLLMMVGKIIIVMIAGGCILAVLGFDMMIIATGAGIIGLAITFGAQSTLSQFFSGFTLLANRPFRPGDMVRIDGHPETLEVMKVGFMMTTFKNWSNSEIFTMPNSKVVSSTIINITAESLAYRVFVWIRVPYGTDVAKAKELALEAMTEHPKILLDGSEDLPKARLDDISDSSLTIRVSGYADDFKDHGSIAAEIRESIYSKYLNSGIEIAVPKIEVLMRDAEGRETKIDI